MDPRLALNRANWNERTPVHAASDFYDLEGFRTSPSSLREIEIEAAGDVAGRDLLHLQCHIGLDTISWALRGANATGVDFSDRAIAVARDLNADLGAEARFLCADVYELPAVLGERFDLVFTSYGVLAWLPDLDRWAQVASRHLRPGGSFLMVEFHPLLGTLAPDGQGQAAIHSYFHYELALPGNEPSYAGSANIASPCVEWQHSLGDVVSALAGAGLLIESLREYPYCAYQAFPHMRLGDDGWWRFPENNDSYPQMFSLKARKPGH